MNNTTNNVSKVIEEKGKLWSDLCNGVIPKRVPIRFNMAAEVSMVNAGMPVGKTLVTFEGLEEAMDRVYQNIESDFLPNDSGRFPLFSQISGSLSSQMSEGGFMQHPEFTTMEPDEYDAFIENPYDFIVEKLIPRTYPRLNLSDPIRKGIILSQMVKSKEDNLAKYGAIYKRLSDKYGFYNVPGIHNGRALAPLDFIADHPRGFSKIVSDVKRFPEKVLAAADAMVPILLKTAMPDVCNPIGAAFMPGHMPTFMRTVEFEKIYYPSFSKLIHAAAERGQAFYIFCEDNWTRYADYLYDLPQGTRMMFEYGDAQLLKDRLGKKHILTGLYPVVLLETGTKEQCVDKAKELIDIMAPGGNYYFSFDKTLISLRPEKLENLYAVLKWVTENTNYSNAGERSMTGEIKATVTHYDIPEFHSKYYVSKEEYKKSNAYILKDTEDLLFDQVQKYEDMMFKFMMGLV